MGRKSVRSLPQEIIENILYRLPAKTIGRCRCVSKSWLALLTEPHFMKTHLKLTRKNPTHSLLLTSDSGALFSIPLNNAHQLFHKMRSSAKKLYFPNISWDDLVSGSCDGLVLIEDSEANILLFNPITLAIRAVPPSPRAPELRDCVIAYGLGYDECGDDYKVVSLLYGNSVTNPGPYPTERVLSIFSVQSGVWRSLESSPYNRVVGQTTSGMFANGCLHWLGRKSPDFISMIQAFNLCDEKFYEVPPPCSLDGTEFAYEILAVIGGCLCIVVSNDARDATDVWVMKEYGVRDSWSKFTIANPEGSEFIPLCLLGEDQVALARNLLNFDRKLVTYDMREGSMKEIVVKGIRDGFSNCGTYVETLVSPGCCHESGSE